MKPSEQWWWDEVVDLRDRLERLRAGQCPDCRQPVQLVRSPEGTAGWRCEHCTRERRLNGWHFGGHGWLTNIRGEWLVVDSGDEADLQRQYEALQQARDYERWRLRHPHYPTLDRVLWQIRHLAQALNARVQYTAVEEAKDGHHEDRTRIAAYQR